MINPEWIKHYERVKEATDWLTDELSATLEFVGLDPTAFERGLFNAVHRVVEGNTLLIESVLKHKDEYLSYNDLMAVAI